MNNAEKGKAADEKYLGEEQNVEARVREIMRVTNAQVLPELSRDMKFWEDEGPPWEY